MSIRGQYSNPGYQLQNLCPFLTGKHPSYPTQSQKVVNPIGMENFLKGRVPCGDRDQDAGCEKSDRCPCQGWALAQLSLGSYKAQRAKQGTGPEQSLEARKVHSSSCKKAYDTDRIQAQKAEKSSFGNLWFAKSTRTKIVSAEQKGRRWEKERFRYIQSFLLLDCMLFITLLLTFNG